MSKITIKATPSAEVIAMAVKPVVVVDGQGRAITLQKPGVLAQFRMIEMLGDTAQNQVYVAMVLPLMFITDIDGEPVARCSTRRELDALIQRMDEDGVLAVTKGVAENFGQSNPEADQATLKN